MITQKRAPQVVSKRRNVTRIGFIGLTDVAPFLVARELGLFAKLGLDVALRREVGWATIRDKVVFGELEAAHALCSMPFSISLGVNSVPVPCVSGLILSRGGDAIVLSNELWKRGVRDSQSFQLDIENRRFFRKYILASVYPCSTQSFILRDWLTASGIDPDRDVELVTLPPSQMCRNLTAGTIDGFCAGEPWPSLAIADDIGWSPASSADISPNHPEKVLMVNERFAQEHQEEHTAMIAALIEACAICEHAEYRSAIARLLADRRVVNCSAEILKSCLSSKFDYGKGRVSDGSFIRFHGNESNCPGELEADWILERVLSCSKERAIDGDAIGSLRSRVFRRDIYDRALAQVDVPSAIGVAETRLRSS